MFRLIIFFIFLGIATLIGFIANSVRKNRMRNALGRDVSQSEMTSLNSWMEVAEKEDAQKQGSAGI